MSEPPAIRITAKEFAAVILAQVFALFLRSYLQLELEERGHDTAHARDLSYLVVPPILLLLLFPALQRHGRTLLGFFSRRDLTIRLVVSAVAVGVLMRIVWWSQLVARGSFGIIRSTTPDAVIGPKLSFACPPSHVIGLGILVMVFLVPVIEELLHRGLIQSALAPKGRTLAILVSALVFMLFHVPSSYVYVYVAGVVFGTQFWNAQTLWATAISHASYNFLVQVDWRCMQIVWNPTTNQLPLMSSGITSIVLLLASCFAIVFLISTMKTGVHVAPRRR